MKILYLLGAPLHGAAVRMALQELRGSEPMNTVPSESSMVRQRRVQAVLQAATAPDGTGTMPDLVENLEVDLAETLRYLEDMAVEQVVVAPLAVRAELLEEMLTLVREYGIAVSFDKNGDAEGERDREPVLLAAALADSYDPPQGVRVLKTAAVGKLRALLLEGGGADADNTAKTVVKLECNLDDMTGEELAYACEKLLAGGALDVWTTAIGMKKGRPGQMLSVLCAPDREQALAEMLFLHTSTIGIRTSVHERHVMTRRHVTVTTPYGQIGAKESVYGATCKIKPEFEEVKKIAEENSLSLAQIYRSINESQSGK